MVGMVTTHGIVMVKIWPPGAQGPQWPNVHVWHVVLWPVVMWLVIHYSGTVWYLLVWWVWSVVNIVPSSKYGKNHWHLLTIDNDVIILLVCMLREVLATWTTPHGVCIIWSYPGARFIHYMCCLVTHSPGYCVMMEVGTGHLKLVLLSHNIWWVVCVCSCIVCRWRLWWLTNKLGILPLSLSPPVFSPSLLARHE